MSLQLTSQYLSFKLLHRGKVGDVETVIRLSVKSHDWSRSDVSRLLPDE